MRNQLMLVAALRTFTGAPPRGYTSEKDFFLTSFHNMAEYLADLQRETLAELCAAFVQKLKSGKATPGAAEDFRSGLDRLISETDFKRVGAAMAGSPAFIEQRLSALEPFSIIKEEKKTAGRDPEAERHIKGAYSRLHFDALVKRVEAEPLERSADAALASARMEVADYCCLYRIPLEETATLTPFSLSCVDAALAASYRLYKDIARASGRSL